MGKRGLFSTLSDDELLAIVSWYKLEPYRPLSYWKEGPFRRVAPLIFRNIRLEGRRLRCMNKDWNQVAVDLYTDFSQLGGCASVFELLNINAEYQHDYSEEEVVDLESYFKDGSMLSIFFPAAAIGCVVFNIRLLERTEEV